MSLLLLLGCLGLITGFLSGLLGIGGGIIMAPLLLFVPPLFSLEPLSMRVVAGLTIIQGLVACISGAAIHRHFRFVSGPLSLYMGITIFITALIGGAAAGYVSNRFLLLLFGALALTAAVLMLIPKNQASEQPDIEELAFSRWRAVNAAGVVGLLGGMVGQGGSFILIPLMTSFVQIPTRIAIGSNLAIVLLATFAAFIGKATTGQIEWLLALPIVLAVTPATIIGSYVSRKVPIAGLRFVLAIIIAAAAVRIWFSIFLS